ncbi:MAG: SCO family protein, partial [Deltaproteobacteria bacterium]|nr:SCO family protein [Deltaproteobacteria bacterium]
AEDFRIWCFGYDPETGRTEWAYVMAMIGPQFMIGAFITYFWWEPLRELSRKPRIIACYLGVAALLVAGLSAGFARSIDRAPSGELPFPAEELRTAYEAPQFALMNQNRETVSLAEFQGNVVILTAVYASCPHTCPVILNQTRAVIAELSPEEREDLRVIAVTMDPKSDSPDILRELAKNHGMQSTLYHLVTGDPTEVERLLDRMQIARKRDPETGVISHTNLFLLIDRDGRIAYRFGLGERQQSWMTSALEILLREEAASG